MSNSLWPHRLQHTRLPCPSPSPGVCSDSHPLILWCHPTISPLSPLLLPPSIFPSIIICLKNIWEHLGETAAAAATESLQSCPTLCDPIDCSPPGSPVPGILQVRTLEWVAISFSNAWNWVHFIHSVPHFLLNEGGHARLQGCRSSWGLCSQDGEADSWRNEHTDMYICDCSV